jgi:hypothetical protein
MNKPVTHREGSRKSKVHALFDVEGETAAYVLGTKLKLQPSSLRTWFSRWRADKVAAALEKNAKAKSKPKVKVPKAA